MTTKPDLRVEEVGAPPGAGVTAPAIPQRSTTVVNRASGGTARGLVRRSVRTGRWAIICIVAAQVIASLRLRNSAFQDEALYLWAGHQITAHVEHGAPLYGNFASYFSGAPDLYPVLASFVGGVWGLDGARDMSLVWMVIATLCVYAVTSRLFAARYAAPAAAVFALSAPILFIGHLATFDAQCLGLLALATYTAVRASGSRLALWAALVGPLLALAVFSKYAGGLFVPSVLAVLILASLRERGWLRALMNLSVALATAALTVVAMAWAIGTTMLTGLRHTTTNRAVSLKSPPWPLIHHVLVLGGFFIALALIGVVVLPRKQRLLGSVLFGTALLAPIYHVYTGEPVSLSKHVGFGLFFAAPLAGYALVRIAGDLGGLSGPRFATATAIGLVLIATGLTQSSSLYHEWSDSDSLIYTLKTMVRPGTGRILAEEAEVPRYRLEGLLQPWQWSDLNWFQYTDHTGATLFGLPAYAAAIRDRYFDVIELRYGANAATAWAIRNDINTSGGYQLVATLPFTTSFGTGAYSVYRVIPPPASSPTHGIGK